MAVWVSVASAVVGGLVGGIGGTIIAYRLGRRARRHDRERDDASALRAALAGVLLDILPRHITPTDVIAARRAMNQAWFIFQGAIPRKVADRIEPLNTVLWWVGRFTTDDFHEHGAYTEVMMRAFSEAFATLDAFIKGERLPAQTFLGTHELDALSRTFEGEGTIFHHWLRAVEDRPAASRRYGLTQFEP